MVADLHPGIEYPAAELTERINLDARLREIGRQCEEQAIRLGYPDRTMVGNPAGWMAAEIERLRSIESTGRAVQ